MMGVTPTINQPPPVMVARHDDSPVTTAAAPLAPAIVTMTAEHDRQRRPARPARH